MNNRSYLYNYIKEQIDNIAFIQQYTKLNKTGKIYKGLCPIHNEKTPSFAVYPPGYIHKGIKQEFASFFCFGCGIAGDIIKFNQYVNNIDNYYNSAINLAEQFDLDIQDDDNIKVQYLQNIALDKINILEIDEINLICSKLLHNYIDNEEVNNYLIYLDNELDNRNTYQAQSLIEETKNFINKLHK